MKKASIMSCDKPKAKRGGKQRGKNNKQTNKSVGTGTSLPYLNCFYRGDSQISQIVAMEAFSKVHMEHGLAISIGAGDDVAVRSLIVSSGSDSDVQPRASNVPLKPPPSVSRR